MIRLIAISLVMLAAGPLAAAPTPTPVKPAPGALTPSEVKRGADESIYVVEKRTYSKSGKFELTPFFFTSLNNKFVGHYGGINDVPGIRVLPLPAALAAAYHVRENLTFEVMTSIPYLTTSYFSALVHDVYDYEQLTPEVVDLKLMSYFAALSAQYSALYGKMEFYGYLIEYDFYVLAGFGTAATIETCPPNREGCGGDDFGIGRGVRAPKDASDRYKLTANLGGGARFFFRDWVGLRIEVRDISYADRASDPDGTTTDIRNHMMFMLGVSFLL